jgi:SAM-dependent methyltransferase
MTVAGGVRTGERNWSGRGLERGPVVQPAEAGADHEEVARRVREQYLGHPFPSPQRRHSYREHARFVRRFLDQLGLDPRGWRFGDIACGTGLMLLDYALEFSEAELVGFDLSEASVARANATLAEEGVSNAKAVLADLLDLSEIEAFDYILSWGTVHHLAEPRAGLEVLTRALKPGGVLRLGVYGYYGNWERHLQQEIIRTLGQDLDLAGKIRLVRDWAAVDPRFVAAQTAPPVDLSDDDWVVDEFLHVWERPLPLRDVVSCLEAGGLEILRLTDYYDQEISLDPAAHLKSPELAERAMRMPFGQRCHLIELVTRPYWLSVLARKGGHRRPGRSPGALTRQDP